MPSQPFYESATYYNTPTGFRIDFITSDASLAGYSDEGGIDTQTDNAGHRYQQNISIRQGVKDSKGKYHNKVTLGPSADNDVIASVTQGKSQTFVLYAYASGTSHASHIGNSGFPRILFVFNTPFAPVPLNRSNPNYGIGRQVSLASLARFGYLGYNDIGGVYHMLFDAVIHTTYGGRNSRNTSVQRIPFTSSLAIGNAAYQSLSDALAAAFATILISSKTVNRIVLTPVNADGSKKVEKNNFMRFDYNTVGARTVGTGVDPAIDQVCALFYKKASFGGGGSIQVRGCYTEAEIASNSSREVATVSGFVNTPFTNFATNLPTIFTSNSAQLILPGENPLNVLEGARNVLSMTYGGPVLRQATRSRKSISQEDRELAARKVRAAERQYEDGVRDNGGTSTQALVNFFLNLIEGLLARYGAELILTYVSSTVLRLAIRALPALGA